MLLNLTVNGLRTTKFHESMMLALSTSTLFPRDMFIFWDLVEKKKGGEQNVASDCILLLYFYNIMFHFNGCMSNNFQWNGSFLLMINLSMNYSGLHYWIMPNIHRYGIYITELVKYLPINHEPKILWPVVFTVNLLLPYFLLPASPLLQFAPRVGSGKIGGGKQDVGSRREEVGSRR